MVKEVRKFKKYPNAMIVSPALYKKLETWGYDMYWFRKWKYLPKRQPKESI